MTNVRVLSLVGIFLVIFIDSMGASLIIPMLTPIAHNSVSGLISVGSESFRNGVYGMALGLFSIAMFFGSPFLGALSDGLGRKKTLLLCLAGLAISYVFLALALAFKSLLLFMAGRLIGGFFSGSLPVAQASIIDVIEEKQRAKYIGYIMFFVSLGYVVGPLIGGYLSDPALVSWFNLQTPFIFVAALSVVNLLILLLVLRAPKGEATSCTVTLPNPFASLLDAVRMRNIRTYASLLLLMLVGWNTFFQFIGLYMTDRLGFGQQEVSSLVSWIGFGLATAFLFLVSVAMKMFKPLSMVMLALVLMALCIGGTLFCTNIYTLYVLAALGAVGFSLSYSGLMSQLSISVDVSRQGSIMGMAAAIAAFSAGFSGFTLGFVANFSVSAPIMSALFCVGLAILVAAKDSVNTLRSE